MAYIRAENDRKPKRLEYIAADGFIHCKLCGKTKEYLDQHGALMEVFGEGNESGRCNCTWILVKIESNRRTAFKDQRSANATFDIDDNPDSDNSKLARNFANLFSTNEQQRGLLFCGGCGSGKSFLAACIANAIIDRGFTAKFTSISEIERDLWAAKDKNTVFNDLVEHDLIILDDFSAERKTEYMGSISYDVIDWIYRSRKTLIVTTNLAPNEFETNDLTKQRIYSRLLEMTLPVKVTGKDRRKVWLKNCADTERERLINAAADNEYSYHIVNQINHVNPHDRDNDKYDIYSEFQ